MILKFRSSRRFLSAIAVLAVCAWLAHSGFAVAQALPSSHPTQQGQARQDEGTFKLRAESNLVAVRVVALDAQLRAGHLNRGRQRLASYAPDNSRTWRELPASHPSRGLV